MAQTVMQKSFNSGEWAPQLYSRVDIEKYRSGAALLRNFFVDYRGGASTRCGTKYIINAYNSTTTVRLIPFQASTSVSYILEFGNYYIRFINNGNPILEAPLTITGASQTNPCVVSVTNIYSAGDWVYISGVSGMVQLNGNYYIVQAATGGSVTLYDLYSNPVDATSFGAYTGGGTIARVYTLPSPYSSADVNQIKFSQNVNALILCHPLYAANSLTLISYNNWSLSSIVFSSAISAPTGVTIATTLAAGTVNYAYTVTAIDVSGNESIAAPPALLNLKTNISTTAGSNSVTWTGVTGAQSYNVYKSNVSYFGVIPTGVPYGFIGNVTGDTIIDTNISADFSRGPPVVQNPFFGASLSYIAQVTNGTYTTVPSVVLSGGSPTASATAYAILGAITCVAATSGPGYAVGDTITLADGLVVRITNLSGLLVTIINQGSITSGATPTNPMPQISTSGGGSGATFTVTWGVVQTVVSYAGLGYASAPSVVYAPAGATATAVLTGFTGNNPSVPAFFQQRLVLAASTINPEGMNFSQPGRYYNYNVSSPIQPSDAISVSLASGQVETIKSMIATGPGLVVLTDKASWLITGGSLGSAVTPSAIVATRSSFNGANDVPPILNNYDILFVEYKGAAVRNATFNYYAQVFTGQDISAIASHRFFGYQITQWTWAQSPFKIVWSVRNDGALLSLTFAKEEEFIAWAYHDTAGQFKSIASVPETLPDGMVVDAVYVIVSRYVNGHAVQYIERFADRIFSGQAKNAWCVDAGIQYNGAPATTFTGAHHLAGTVVTGLADGVVIPPFVMPTSGSFTLATAASLVTVGYGFLAQLQTLPLDVGEPTIQGRQKKISTVVVRCVDTLGLSIGSSFTSLTTMQDLVVGNVGSLTNSVVTDLVTGDALTIVDPFWSEQGQFCIQQSLPFPATITGVMPNFTIGAQK